MWMGLASTLFMQAAAGPFLHINMAVESVCGVAQIVAACFLGTLADRVDRYRLARIQAVTRAIPVPLLAVVVAMDARQFLFLVMPLLAVSSHLGDAVRQALLVDNPGGGPGRAKAMFTSFSP